MADALVFDDAGFQRLGAPKPGEWLFHFHEPGQSFEEYVASHPHKATAERRVLAFLPVGPFSPVEQEIVHESVQFAQSWFDLPTRIEPMERLPGKKWYRLQDVPWRGEPVKQFQTLFFLRKLLPKRFPKDGICFMAITMADLYPDANWHFVFGQADPAKRIGVFSMARYFPGFWGKEIPDESKTLALRRGCKVMAHEIGHVFGMAHCIYYQCVMNGSNSLKESDRRPLRLCPVCLKKLHWNRGFHIRRRYEHLQAFFDRNRLEEEARWLAGRLKAWQENT